MMLLHRRLVAAAEDEASKLGVSVSFENRKKHVFIVVTTPKGTRRHIMSRGGTKNDIGNMEDWARQKIRRSKKELDGLR